MTHEEEVEFTKAKNVEEPFLSKETIADCEMTLGEKLNELLNINTKTLTLMTELVEIMHNGEDEEAEEAILIDGHIFMNAEKDYIGISKEFRDCLVELRRYQLIPSEEEEGVLPLISKMIHNFVCSSGTRFPDKTRCIGACKAAAHLTLNAGYKLIERK